MAANIDERLHKAEHREKLCAAGYAPISRMVLMLARLRVVDAFRIGKRILPRRPICLVSLVVGRSRPVGIELTVVTTRPEVERAAVKITVRYFTLLGSEIAQPEEDKEFILFADPLEQTQAQCFLCPPPAGARWCVVKIARQTDERRIGVHGSLRPKIRNMEEVPPLNEALKGRQRHWLAHHLVEAEKARDRQTAMQLLSRMIFLERRASDMRNLRLVSDINQVISDFSEQGKVPVLAKGQNELTYQKLLTTAFDNSLPLSKWLASEAIILKNTIGAPHAETAKVSIPVGENLALRVLAAYQAGFAAVVETSQGQLLDKLGDIPWVKDEELLSFFD